MNFDPKNSPNKLAKDCLDWLRSQNGLSGIMTRAEELAKLKKVLKLALTALNLGHFSDRIEPTWRVSPQEELLLIVPNAALAARLEQVLPSLSAELTRHSYRCPNIKVRLVPSQMKLQPGGLRSKPKRGPVEGLNAVARLAWLNLLKRLPPDSKLRHSIERLLAARPK